MNVPNLRSPRETVGGLVHFGRMLDKIRLHAAGKLPADYHAALGVGFDGRTIAFLHVAYADVVAQVKAGASDEAVLEWCYQHGRKPTEDEIEIWDAFMSKRGWRDDGAESLAKRIAEAPDLAGRTDILTSFDFIDADEGRL
ncbi:MAG: DUF5069 domain-containing protein [Chthoniobacteraceae bacterium]